VAIFQCGSSMNSSERRSGFPYNLTLIDLIAGHSHTMWCANRLFKAVSQGAVIEICGFLFWWGEEAIEAAMLMYVSSPQRKKWLIDWVNEWKLACLSGIHQTEWWAPPPEATPSYVMLLTGAPLPEPSTSYQLCDLLLGLLPLRLLSPPLHQGQVTMTHPVSG